MRAIRWSQRGREEEGAARPLERAGRDGPEQQAGDPVLARSHDFPGPAAGRAVGPYGVYDIAANRGFVTVGTSRDTPAFAVGRRCAAGG